MNYLVQIRDLLTWQVTALITFFFAYFPVVSYLNMAKKRNAPISIQIGDYTLSFGGSTPSRVEFTEEERKAILSLTPELLRYFCVTYFPTNYVSYEFKSTPSILSKDFALDTPTARHYTQQNFLLDQLKAAGVVYVDNKNGYFYRLTPLGNTIREKLLTAVTRNIYVEANKP